MFPKEAGGDGHEEDWGPLASSTLPLAEQLQAPPLLAHLQAQHLLQHLLPLRLLRQPHPLQLLCIQPQQRPAWEGGREG